MAPVKDMRWEQGYIYRPFAIATTSLEFEYSKTIVEVHGARICASNLAVAWTSSGVEETILGGVVQGRKAFDPRGASQTSRRRMWEEAQRLEALVVAANGVSTHHLSSCTRYRDIKALSVLEARNVVKRTLRDIALSGWICNDGDSDFELDQEAQTV
jgi:tRNA-specific adenosine deaminase 1